MTEGLLLFYQFVTFAVGIACLSALVVVARRDPHGLARPFLVPYSALSLLVMAVLLPSLLPGLGIDDEGVSWLFQYLESFVGRYAVMFSVPYFMHRLFGLDRRRDWIVLAITLVTLVAQHFTEFGLSGRWDEAGDVFEDVVLAGVVVYSMLTAFLHRKDPGIEQPIATTFLVLLLLAIPGFVYDLFLRSDSAWRFHPLWYGVTSVVMTLSLVRRPTPAAALPWGLSDREEEVVRLVGRGLSNKAIARELEISPNTVKTHLRSAFDKSGIRTRYGLMAALAPTRDPSEPPPAT